VENVLFKDAVNKIPSWSVSMERWWNDTDRKKLMYLLKI
jgi:hypothetical protein